MTWMNEYEVRNAEVVFADHPVLGPATTTLVNLVDVVNCNSDGWPYWQAPSKASAKLQTIIDGAVRDRWRGNDITVTAADVRKALTPIKAFLTRKGLQCEVVAP